MSSCISCNKLLAKDSLFCKYCGENQTQQKPNGVSLTKLPCLACGAPLLSGAKFCRSCGTEVSLESKVLSENPTALMQSNSDSPITPSVTTTSVKRPSSKTILWAGILAIAVMATGIGVYYGYKTSLGENIADFKQSALSNTDATAKVQAWIQSQALPYNSQADCYISPNKTEEGIQYYCYRLSETREIKDGSNTYVYATIGGTYLNDDGTLGGSGVDQGIIQFFKFRIQNDKVEVASDSGSLYSGRFGVPDSSWIIVLGKENRIGWALNSGWAGMGEVYQQLNIFAPINDVKKGVKQIISIQTILSTVDACSDDDKDCISREINTVVKQSKGNEDYYPLKLSTSIKQGTKNNKTSDRKEITVYFDTKKNVYKVPESYNSIFK